MTTTWVCDKCGGDVEHEDPEIAGHICDRDYHDEDGSRLVCPHCQRPTFYDYADEAYHHDVEPERGCFLIAAETAR